MGDRAWMTVMSMSVALSGMLLVAPFAVRAQENAPTKSEEGACPMCQEHMGKEHKPGARHAEYQQRHEQMEAMHREMTRELEQQLTTLRDHAKTMDSVSDQTQLLTEMKKHQQMTDALLGTMVEQHQKMHARMHEHHKGTHGTMHHRHNASESEAKPKGAE